jgi:hypothetical protein
VFVMLGVQMRDGLHGLFDMRCVGRTDFLRHES